MPGKMKPWRVFTSIQPRPGGKSVVNTDNREMTDVIGGKGKTKVEFFTNGGGISWISDRRVASIQFLNNHPRAAKKTALNPVEASVVRAKLISESSPFLDVASRLRKSPDR